MSALVLARVCAVTAAFLVLPMPMAMHMPMPMPVLMRWRGRQKGLSQIAWDTN